MEPGRYDGPWYTWYNYTTFVTVFQVLMKWKYVVVHHGKLCQMLLWWTKNSLYSIDIRDTVTKVSPLCSIYKVPSHEPNLTCFFGMLFIFEMVCTLWEMVLAMWDQTHKMAPCIRNTMVTLFDSISDTNAIKWIFRLPRQQLMDFNSNSYSIQFLETDNYEKLYECTRLIKTKCSGW